MDRWVENGLLDVLENEGVGAIAFSPLKQGILTNKYLNGFPEDSRAVKDARYLQTSQLDEATISTVKQLNEIAISRNQTLAQMAIAWLLKDKRITSVLVGASKPAQLLDSIKALDNLAFNAETLNKIETILKKY